jgi:hypothetical protein
VRLAAAAAACCAVLSAHAADGALLSRDMAIDPQKDLAETRLIEDLVVAPIPISNPTVGTGLAVVVMPFYHLMPGSPLSNTAVAAGYTSSGSWGIGATQSTRIRGDELRVDGFLGYVELRYNFFGVGAAAGGAGVSVPIVQKGGAFVPELLFQVLKRAFLGVRYRGVRVETAPDGEPPALLEPLLNQSITVTSSGIGPVAVFDTRDNEMNPASGVLIDFRGNFADESVGSDFNYRTFTLAANYYRRAGPGILALRGFFCGVSDKTPLFDLCLYGAGSDLRGYEAGRYRDRSMFALQGEYRFPLRGRFGAVVFAGNGKVAPSFGDMGDEPDLPSIGAGLRWLASEKARVNLSIDVAKGRDGTAAYVYVKEAF